MQQDFAIIPATEWLVLTCSKPVTLPLAASLNESGIEAWSPVTREERRKGDQRTREEIAVPLMASFVFARARYFHTLLAISRSPAMLYRVWDSELRKMVVRGHPPFRLLRGGNHRFVPDWELEPLRQLERKPRPKRIDRVFGIGEKVRTDDGGFAGLVGTVTAIKGKAVTVAFPKWGIEPVFPTWALRPLDETGLVNVRDSKPECDAA